MFKKIKNYIKNDDNKIKLGETILTVGLPLSMAVMTAGIIMMVNA